MTNVVDRNPKALVGPWQAKSRSFTIGPTLDSTLMPSIISNGIERTENPVTTVTLTPAAQKFVLHWGEMGQAWGINRTMAQVHALLFVTPEALDAEEISRLLDVSRSNVSTSLRELITWGVVRRVHIIGDRRDRFEALKDVMETFRVIMAERKRREMDPTIALLEHCVVEAKAGDPPEQYTREQLEKMLDFVRLITTWYGHIDRLSTPGLERLFRDGPRLVKLFGWLDPGRARPVDTPDAPPL
jgi:DNA-binding transcriptional regulator GbsR (MarR family)